MKEDYCFVIMPFTDEHNLKDVYDVAIKPAVEKTGLKCIRVDEVDGTGNIVRKIVELICNARLIIADLTSKNPNVFYELGISHSLGDKTIVIAQDISRDVPFDVKSYKVIQYGTSMRGGIRLQEDLVRAIETFEDWSASPSNPVQDFLPASAKKKVSEAEHDELISLLKSKEVQLAEVQRKLSELEKDRAMIEDLKKKSAQLEILSGLVKQLIPADQLKNKSEAEVVQDIINKVETEGEVSVNVGPEQGNKKTPSGKIIFKKVN